MCAGSSLLLSRRTIRAADRRFACCRGVLLAATCRFVVRRRGTTRDAARLPQTATSVAAPTLHRHRPQPNPDTAPGSFRDTGPGERPLTSRPLTQPATRAQNRAFDLEVDDGAGSAPLG